MKPGDNIADHPMIKNAFKTIGALLIATNANDLDCDFELTDHEGQTVRFHVRVDRMAFASRKVGKSG